MNPTTLHARWAETMAALLRDPDPPGALARLLRDPATPPALKAMLVRVDPAGLQLSAILVARLRFERLMQGSAEARWYFEKDPEGFAEEFRRYHLAVAPRSSDPLAEARAWARHRTRRAA